MVFLLKMALMFRTFCGKVLICEYPLPIQLISKPGYMAERLLPTRQTAHVSNIIGLVGLPINNKEDSLVRAMAPVVGVSFTGSPLLPHMPRLYSWIYASSSFSIMWPFLNRVNLMGFNIYITWICSTYSTRNTTANIMIQVRKTRK